MSERAISKRAKREEKEKENEAISKEALRVENAKIAELLEGKEVYLTTNRVESQLLQNADQKVMRIRNVGRQEVPTPGNMTKKEYVFNCTVDNAKKIIEAYREDKQDPKDVEISELRSRVNELLGVKKEVKKEDK